MQLFVWILLGLLVTALLAVCIAVWLLWEIRLHYAQGALTIYIRVLRFQKKVFHRVFSEKGKSDTAKKPDTDSPSQNTAAKQETASVPQQKWKKKLQEDKKRIYDPEKGGYQPGGLESVLAEYRELWKQFWEVLGGILEALRYKIAIPKTMIQLQFGTGNPAHTGMAFGSVWGAVGAVYPILCRYFHMAYPDLQVTPDFNQKCFALEAESIIKVRPVHIINAVIKQALRLAVTYCYKHFSKESVKYG